MSVTPNAPHPNQPPPPESARTPATAGADATEILLVGASVLDVERGCLCPAGTALLLRAGRIAQVLTAAEVAAQSASATRRVDLRGRYLVPGLVNTHAHLQIVMPSLLPSAAQNQLIRRYGWTQRYRNLRECTRRGVTTVRDTLNQDLRRTETLRRRARCSRPRGPRILQAVLVGPLGGVFTLDRGPMRRAIDWLVGLPVVPYDAPYSGVVAFAPDADAATVRRAVDRAIDERGADAIKLYDQREQLLSFRPTATIMTAAQLDAAVDQCRKRGVASTMHLLTVESFRRAVAAGVTSIAHLPSDGPLSPSDVAAASRAGVIVEPTVSLLLSLCWNLQSHTAAERERLQQLRNVRLHTSRSLAEEHWHPMLAPWFLDGLARSAAGQTGLLGGLYDGRRIFEYYGGLVGHGIDNLVRLCEAGVPIACGTDAGAVPCTPAMVSLELGLHRQLLGERLASPAAVLRAATWNAARALGTRSVVGLIAPGAPADLVAYDRNPLDDPSVLGERAAAVWREGEAVVEPAGAAAPAS